MICKTCNAEFFHDSGNVYYKCDDCFLIENEHPLGFCETWDSIGNRKRDDILKYLKLMKRFNKSPSLLSRDHKKWMLEHCDLPTELVPVELMGEFWL